MMPCAFSLFPQFKNTLNSKQFEDVVTTELKVTTTFRDMYPEQRIRSTSSIERKAGIRGTNQKGSISNRISLL
jgi:hypothetical protein